MSRHVFTYGSLMFDAVWSRVIEGTYARVDGNVDRHRRFAIAGEDYPGMVPRDDSKVAGVLYLDVDEGDLRRLDRFEGDDYRRVAVAVAGADGNVRDAETYLYLRTDRLLATSWEPDRFAMQRFLETYCRDRFDPS